MGTLSSKATKALVGLEASISRTRFKVAGCAATSAAVRLRCASAVVPSAHRVELSGAMAPLEGLLGTGLLDPHPHRKVDEAVRPGALEREPIQGKRVALGQTADPPLDCFDERVGNFDRVGAVWHREVPSRQP